MKSGIRVNELANLKVKDIDFLNSEINVIRKGNKVDTVIITKSALDRLNEYITSLPFKLNREDYVFISKTRVDYQ